MTPPPSPSSARALDTGPSDPADPRDDATQEQVERALQQIAPRERRPRVRLQARHWLRILVYAAILLAASALLYGLRLGGVAIPTRYVSLAQRLARGGMLVAVVLLAGALADGYLVGRFDDAATRYNVRRVIRFLQAGVMFFIVLSVLFVNWYTAAVSLGIAGAIVGFALQVPISSLIGWMYILAKQPYKVGDRIQIGNATGDVIDVDYLDTTLWEFGGPYVSTDHPSGRLIRFPNANVLSTAVYNYSWPLFPYIWNEVYVQVAYGSDLQFVAETMRRVVDEELGERMAARVSSYCQLLARTPVDELQVQSHPAVLFRVSENTWVEAVVRYVVSPRRAGVIKSRLTTRILEALNAQPGRVCFPKGDSR